MKLRSPASWNIRTSCLFTMAVDASGQQYMSMKLVRGDSLATLISEARAAVRRA